MNGDINELMVAAVINNQESSQLHKFADCAVFLPSLSAKCQIQFRLWKSGSEDIEGEIER
jgi:hypothetical protein